MLGNEGLSKEIIAWSTRWLSSHGYILKSTVPEMIQHTPWSYVLRFETSAGYVYLKHTPTLLALEATIIQVLHDQFHAPVPVILGHTLALNCFLMKDAGKPLRELLKKQFDPALICKAIDQFASLQLSVVDHINTLFAIGVPDWRLDKIPTLYQQLLTHNDLLIEDGLSNIDINRLIMLTPTVANLCENLSAYSIKQTIVQPDFSDNNTLIDTAQNITIIDLGEIVISHPYFSLFNCLQQMKKHYGLTEKDHDYLLIRDTYLNQYMVFKAREKLLDAFKIAYPLWLIYETLAGLRLVEACGKSTILSHQHGKLVAPLRVLLALFPCK